MNPGRLKIMAFLKRAFWELLKLISFIVFTSIGALATAQVVSFFRPPQTYQLIFSENGYNVFQDIFTDIDGLRAAINSLPASSQNNEALNQKINALEDTVNKISDTIMNKPDQAITAKLLQNDQGAIKDRVLKLEGDVLSLNTRIDNLYTIIISISVGLVGTVGGLKLWRMKKKDSIYPAIPKIP
jgi:cell division protein FtsB